MSTYNKNTVHPLTKVCENATWYDDFFGRHNYGVYFPSDNKVFRADEFDWQENPLTMALEGKPRANPDVVPLTIREYKPKPQVIEEKAGAHEAVITKHDDGSQDVKINVTRLNLENRTPEDTIAEEAIIDTLKSVKVGVVILCKATGDNTYFVSPLTEVRSRSEQVLERFFEKADSKTLKAINSYCELMQCETKKAFSIIEVAVGEKPPTISTL